MEYVPIVRGVTSGDEKEDLVQHDLLVPMTQTGRSSVTRRLLPSDNPRNPNLCVKITKFGRDVLVRNEYI